MKNNYNILTYFLTNVLFLGSGLSIIFKLAKHDSYIAIILGTLLGIFNLYIIHKFVLNKKLNSYLKIIYLIYLISIIFIILVSLSSFISSYYLIKTPIILSCVPLIFLAVYGSKNITKIYYIAIPLLVISIAIIIFKSTILISEIDISNIYPILSSNIIDLFKGVLFYSMFSTAPSLLLINENISFKKSLKYYLISSLFIFITAFILITSLGNLVTTLSYPEYSILRKVRLLKFIENIEGILAITWIFDIFITLSIASLKLKELFNTKSNLLAFIIISIALLLISLTVSNNYYYLISVYKYHAITLSAIMNVLMTLIIFFGKKKVS